MTKDFISIHDITRYEFHELLDLAIAIKENPDKYRKTLKGQVLAMIFEKPSLRTRVTFEVGMHELGGQAIYLSPAEIQLGKRETVEDVAHNLERWVDGIMIRTFGHDNVVRLAKASSVPVINGLSDLTHPCQGMADFLDPPGAQGRAVQAQADLRRRREQRLPQPHARRGQGRDEDGRRHARRATSRTPRWSSSPSRTARTRASSS